MPGHFGRPKDQKQAILAMATIGTLRIYTQIVKRLILDLTKKGDLVFWTLLVVVENDASRSKSSWTKKYRI